MLFLYFYSQLLKYFIDQLPGAKLSSCGGIQLSTNILKTTNCEFLQRREFLRELHIAPLFCFALNAQILIINDSLTSKWYLTKVFKRVIYATSYEHFISVR